MTPKNVPLKEEFRVLVKKEFRPSVSEELPETPDPSVPSILEEAMECTSGDRRRDYAHPLPNHQRIAAYWNAHLHSVGIEGVLTPADVALMMILLKVARQARTPKRDNLVDIAGYARCVAQIEQMEP